MRSRPTPAFLDVHMPGLNGVEVARAIGDAPPSCS